MRRILAWAATAAVLVSTAACGDKAGGGPVGTWTIDVERTMGPAFDAAKAEMKKGLADLPADQRAMAEKLMPSDDKLRETVRTQFAKMQGTFELKSDGSATMDFTMGEEKETGTATWIEKDGKYLVTPKTKNGKPVEGKDAETVELEMKDGALGFSTGAGGPKIWLKRK